MLMNQALEGGVIMKDEKSTRTLGSAATASSPTSPSSILSAYLGYESPETDGTAIFGQLIETPWALVALKIDSSHTNVDHQAGNALEGSFGFRFVTTQHDGVLVALVPFMQSHMFIETLLDTLDNPYATAAISLPFGDADAIPQQWGLLQFCLAHGGSVKLKRGKDFAMRYLRDEIKKNVPCDSLLHPALKKLAAYDDAYQANMFDTLRVYLENDRNAQRCAKELYLHRNSLQYRIKRIQEIADIDLDDPEERSYLRLSFFLYEN